MKAAEERKRSKFANERQQEIDEVKRMQAAIQKEKEELNKRKQKEREAAKIVILDNEKEKQKRLQEKEADK